MEVDCRSYRGHRSPGWGTLFWHIGDIAGEDVCYEVDMVEVVHETQRQRVCRGVMQRTDSLLSETKMKVVRLQRHTEGMNERPHCYR